MSLREISFILVSPFDLEARYYYYKYSCGKSCYLIILLINRSTLSIINRDIWKRCM